MDNFFFSPAGQRTQAQTALVAVLHSHDGIDLAHELMLAWAPRVPAAAMSTVLVAGIGDLEGVLEQIAYRLGPAGLDVSCLGLAGVGGGEETALQLVFGQTALKCAGVVVCGDDLPPLQFSEQRPVVARAKLRLVWTADDPLLCAQALGDLLRLLRASGLDAQGTVLPRQDCPPREPGGRPVPPLPLMRLGGSYLAELVAVALDAASRPHVRPLGTG